MGPPCDNGKGQLSHLFSNVGGSAARVGDSYLCLLDVVLLFALTPILPNDGIALHYLWLVLMHASSPFKQYSFDLGRFPY